MHQRTHAFELCTQVPDEANRASRTAREREAKEYRDRLTPEQEAWVLRKMRFAEFGRGSFRAR
jgi:hypothetical protein